MSTHPNAMLLLTLTPDDLARKTHRALMEWVWRYFSTDWRDQPLPAALGQRVTRSSKPPLFFQHQGHSRTIIGAERRRRSAAADEETLLLVLDPSHDPRQLASSLRSPEGKMWPGMLKRGDQSLKRAEYQLVAVRPGIAGGAERFALQALAYGSLSAAGATPPPLRADAP